MTTNNITTVVAAGNGATAAAQKKPPGTRIFVREIMDSVPQSWEPCTKHPQLQQQAAAVATAAAKQQLQEQGEEVGVSVYRTHFLFRQELFSLSLYLF